MKQLFILLTITICLISLPTKAMDTWHFKSLVCPEPDEPINKEALLDANPFWKHVAEKAPQEIKIAFLEDALNLPGNNHNQTWKYRRNAIMCVLATGNIPHPNGLITAMLADDYPLSKFALQCGADPNIKCGDTPSFFFSRSLKIAKLLIQHEANVLSLDDENRTVLHRATVDSTCSPDLIPYYIQQGCDVNARDKSGNTPIMESVNNFDITKFRLLLENGADINITKDYDNAKIVTVWDIAWRKKCFKQATAVYDQFQQKCKAYGLLVSAVRLFSNQS